MKLVGYFVNKCVSVLRLGNSWFARLLGSLVEAGRTISYVETVSPSQSDTLHKELKWCDLLVFKRAFEKSVRKTLRCLRFGRVKVAVDVTEDPYWGKQGLCNTRARVHEKSDESWQFLNLSIVEPFFVPLMSLPYRQVDNLDDLVIDLLEYLRTLPLSVELVLFDRGFYHARLVDYLESCRGGKPWPYLILAPKNEAVKKYITKTENIGAFRHQMVHSKNKTKWKPITKIVICKSVSKDKKGKPIDWCFATNQPTSLNLIWHYKKRWNIETGFRIHDEVKIKSKSSFLLVRYFYHLVSMLIIIMWRLHNDFQPYMVFKRYLKKLEMQLVEVLKPPPQLTNC